MTSRQELLLGLAQSAGLSDARAPSAHDVVTLDDGERCVLLRLDDVAGDVVVDTVVMMNSSTRRLTSFGAWGEWVDDARDPPSLTRVSLADPRLSERLREAVEERAGGTRVTNEPRRYVMTRSERAPARLTLCLARRLLIVPVCVIVVLVTDRCVEALDRAPPWADVARWAGTLTRVLLLGLSAWVGGRCGVALARLLSRDERRGP